MIPAQIAFRLLVLAFMIITIIHSNADCCGEYKYY